MRFVSLVEVVERFHGKRVALVGGAPTVLDNKPGFVDGHDVVVRVNNYRTGEKQGVRCDVFYSFFGGSIKKTAEELKADGVTLCMCKVPNSRPINSAWHESRRKLNGIDFRYIFEVRKSWWFCDTYIPDDAHFIRSFELLGRHIPTTGFAAILDVLGCMPRELYLTGFDGFASGLHNVNEKWRPGDPSDPIGHRPGQELAWLARNADRFPVRFDEALQQRISNIMTAESTDAVAL